MNTHLLTLISIRFIEKGKKGRSTFEAHLFISNKGLSSPPPTLHKCPKILPLIFKNVFVISSKHFDFIPL